jgi:hypothetical protein
MTWILLVMPPTRGSPETALKGRRDDDLWLEIGDDGAGGADPSRSGLVA